MSEGHDPGAPAQRRGVSRRQLLIGGASAGGALAVGGAVAGLASGAGSSSASTGYHLQVLSAGDAALYGAMADRIFPPDSDGPGAKDLGFVPYLDGQLASAWGSGEGLYKQGPAHEATSTGLGYQLTMVPKDLYRAIAPRIDAYAQQKQGGTFASLDGATQDKLLTDLQGGKVDLGLASTPLGYTSASFFADFQSVVNQALFADPMYGGNKDMGGWEWIGFPGDPMGYGDAYWAIFPHQNDPYEVQPRSITQDTMGGFQGIEGANDMSGMEMDN